MVGAGDSGEGQDIGHIVWEEHESCGPLGQVVPQLVVCAVVQAAVPFGGNDLSVLIAGKPCVGVGRSPLSGICHEFGVCHGKRDGHVVAGKAGDGSQGIGGSRGAPSEGRSRGVFDDSHIFSGNAGGFGDIADIGVDAHGLAVHGQHAVVSPVGLDRVAFDGHMGLSRGVEASFHHIGCLLKELRGIVARALDGGLHRPDVRMVLMDAHGVGHGRFQIVQVFGKLFEIHGDLCRCRSGVLLGIRCYQGYDIPIVEDLLFRKEDMGLLRGKASG